VSATVAGTTAQVINAGLASPTSTENRIGLYQVDMIMPSSLASNPNAQVYIAQDAFVSNIATMPVAGSSNPLVTFTASPNPIITNDQYGQTTISWQASGIDTVEVHMALPAADASGNLVGPIFTRGAGASGSAATGNWVADGTTFYLVDVSNGKEATNVNIIATLVARVGTKSSVTTFTASDVNLPPGYFQGISTLSWNAPASTAVAIHVGAIDGPLFTTGTASGSATTGFWVQPGTTFYLVDTTTGELLKTVSPTVRFNVPPTFTISPNPIFAPYSPGGFLGTATISWNSPYTSNVEVHVGSPTGPMFTSGQTTGSATTGAWVGDGAVFYLQDVSNGFPLNSDHTLATVTARVLQQPESGYLLASTNPIVVPAGQQFGTATLNWSTTTGSHVEVHVGAPNGPLFTAGGAQGSARTGNWVRDGTRFYLQDASNGGPLTSQFTIATQTVNFSTSGYSGSLQASPNPIVVPAGTTIGTTTLYWSSPSSVTATEIHLGTPDGPIVTRYLGSGSLSINWAGEGTTLYLLDASSGRPTNVIGAVTLHLANPAQ
jgi:hypothetical protein